MFQFGMESLTERKQGGWVGFDLDGTLATYDGWKGWDHIGDPIQKTVDLAKSIMDQGVEVKILTARASAVSRALNNLSFEQVEAVIQAWTEKHIGAKLSVVTEKDCNMYFFVDDSAVQVEKNTGVILGKLLPIGDEKPVESIVEYDTADVNNLTDPNVTRISEDQITSFNVGLVNGGFTEAVAIECGGTQVCVEAKNESNITRFCLDTYKGNLTNEETTIWLQMDVLVAQGSNRFMFKFNDTDFKSLGDWISKKVLK